MTLDAVNQTRYDTPSNEPHDRRGNPEMTNEELLAAITSLTVRAEAAAANANAAATTANASANQASAGSAGGVAGARTQSNTEASQIATNVDSDIGINEAWSVNNKRTYDVHQSLDVEAMQRNRVHFDALVSQQLKHVANLDHMTMQALANNQNQSNLNNTLSIDRSWNVNETDAFATTLAAKVADTLFAKAKTAAA